MEEDAVLLVEGMPAMMELVVVVGLTQSPP
jgi:hypothetical protein